MAQDDHAHIGIGRPSCRLAMSFTTCTAMPPNRTVSDNGMAAAHGAMSLLPRTTLTGAIDAGRARMSGPPMSPPRTMWSQPARKASASGRRRLWVPEMRAMRAWGILVARPLQRALERRQ